MDISTTHKQDCYQRSSLARTQMTMPATSTAPASGPNFCHPRRGRTRDVDEQASLFLRKAYHVVSNCPPHLGGWSASGETFIVKDAKTFSEKVIPTVYKHNNFSSFVRQLNFYGFRKIKSDISSVESPYWEFRHPKFVRGMPHLLFEIKRTIQGKAVPDESAALQSSVGELKERLVNVDESISNLTRIVSSLIRDTAEARTTTQSPPSSFCPENVFGTGSKRCCDEIDPTENPPRQYKRMEMPSGDEGYLRSPVEVSPLCDSYESEIDEESLSDLINFCSQDTSDAKYPGCPTDDNDLIDFDDFLTFSASLQDEPTAGDVMSLCSSTVPETFMPSHDRGNSTAAPGFSSNPALTDSVDVPSIMSQLSSVMQARFIDKFAESAGKYFCAIVSDPHLATNPGSNREQLDRVNNETNDLLLKKNILFDKINQMENVFLSRGLFK